MATEMLAVKILEIDTTHSGGREQVAPLIDPIVNRENLEAMAANTGIELKAGDLPDADFDTYDSYFVGIRYPRTEPGESQVRSILAQCQQALRGVGSAHAIEIPESHPAYARILSSFGW